MNYLSMVALVATIPITLLTANGQVPQAISTPKQEAVFEHVRLVSQTEKAKPKSYKAGERMSAKDLKSLLYSVGFRGQNLKEAWGIVMKESTGRPSAHNRNSNTGDNSHGLFQINMIGSLGPARLKQFNLESNKDLFDPLTNAKIGYKMSDGGKNWSPWNGLTESALKWMKEFPE